jgi:chorismate mutase/prephenate dehydrogenase
MTAEADSTNHLPGPPTEATEANALAGLEELRRDIDAIDERIVDLLAQRHKKVQRVVALKRAQRLPVYHPAREEDLISQRRAQAARAGLDPDHVEELFRSILRQSRVRQTVQVTRTGVRAGAKVLMIGGRGKMGRYFGRWFSECGYAVRLLDVDDWPRVGELCAGIDLAFVCVPIDRTVAVIRDLGPHLPLRCVLADITSVKGAALEAMLAAHAGPVVGLHPLFGPTTSTMDKQVVAATPGRMPEDYQWLVDQFTAWGNIVLPLTADEHDRLMAIAQSLRHFATFAFGDFLCGQNVNVARTLELSSPIYRLELGMIGRLFAQDPALYAEILFASPERRALLQEYVDSLNRHRAMLESGDKAAFCAEFKRIADWFGPFCEQAMRESNFLIDKLVERF